jgi:hypothetical protein
MALTDKEIRAHLEPEVEGMPVSMATEISIAISMKRIADKMCGDPDLAWHIRDAIETAIFNATRR